MFVKDVVLVACEFLDKQDLYEKISSNENLSGDEQKDVDLLTNSFNNVWEEICTEIFPIVKCEKFKTQNLKVSFQEFSTMPVSILAIKDCSGRKVRSKVLNDGIVAFANEIEVWYTVKPENLSFESEFASHLPERVFAYGVAREFYIKKALYKDASVWEERFKNSIEMLDRNKSARILMRRRWL